MNELAPKYRRKVFFAKVDADRDDQVAEFFEVEDVPELYFLCHGDVEVYTDERLTRAELRDAIEDVLIED